MTTKLIALVLPFGLDTLAVALALVVAGFPRGRRLQLSFLLAGFEAAMSLIGITLGATLGRAIGVLADYFAAGLVAPLRRVPAWDPERPAEPTQEKLPMS